MYFNSYMHTVGSVTGPPEYEWTEHQYGTYNLAIIPEIAALSEFH